MISWAPVGISKRAPGSAPFKFRVGTLQGQVQEMVWVTGTVVVGEYRSYDAGALALGHLDSSAPGGRRVLAYLPEALISVPNGSDPVPDSEAARARAEAIAKSIGVRFAVCEVKFGENPNVLFPGVMPDGRGAKFLAWGDSVMFMSFGALMAVAGAWGGLATHGQLPFMLGLAAVGLFLFGCGLATYPPVVRARRAARQRRGVAT